MPESLPFRVRTDGDKKTNSIKLAMGGHPHGTFKSVEELLRYAARVRTGRIVLVPGGHATPAGLKMISAEIRRQAAALKEKGFK